MAKLFFGGMFLFLAVLPNAGRSGECCICQESKFLDSLSLPCGHSFHCRCITEWFKEQKQCPQCGTDMNIDDLNMLVLQQKQRNEVVISHVIIFCSIIVALRCIRRYTSS